MKYVVFVCSVLNIVAIIAYLFFSYTISILCMIVKRDVFVCKVLNIVVIIGYQFLLHTVNAMHDSQMCVMIYCGCPLV